MQGDDASDRRTPVAPEVGARRGDAPSPAFGSTHRAEEDPSRRGDAGFRLLPDTPDANPRRNLTAGGRDDGATFARVMEEARAQIRRQLAAERTAPAEVHVTIGRIEVSAALPAPSAPRKAPERMPAVSLEQYLASRARRSP